MDDKKTAKKIKKIFFLALLVLLLTIFIIFIITPKAKEGEELTLEFQSGDTIAWEDVDELLMGGEVEMVMQTHNLDVTFTLDDGTVLETKEPKIDDIFKEIEKCGELCDDIILMTE